MFRRRTPAPLRRARADGGLVASMLLYQDTGIQWEWINGRLIVTFSLLKHPAA